jgi:protein O-mannosyl-transferase
LPSSVPTSTRRLEAGLGCGLVLLTVLSYWGIWRFDFVSLDDPAYVIANPGVHGLTGENVRQAVTSRYQGYWAPLLWISFMVDYEIGGLDPASFHAGNLVLHAAAVVLLFLALARLTKATWRSAVVAAIFAAHPVHVEAVAWVTERKEMLASVFWMISLLAYAGYARRRSWRWALLGILSMALGLMSKPTLVTLPIALLLLDYWPLERLRRRGDVLPLVLEKAPLLALSLASSWMTSLAARDALVPLSTLGVGERLANAVISYVRYLRFFFWPVDLSPFYTHDRPHPVSWPTALAALTLIAITAAALRLRREHPYVLMGWLWYLATLVPVIGLVQVGDQGLADRFLHIPSIGLSITVVWGLAELAARAQVRRSLLAGAAAGLLLALGAASRLQAGYWRDGITLDQRAIAVTGGAFLPHRNLALALANAGRMEEAAAQLEAALRFAPNSATAYSDLGLCYLMLDRDADAQAALDRALRLEPGNVGARRNLAILLASTDRIPEAIAQFEQTLGQPGAQRAALDLALELERLGRRAEAERVRERIRP